MFLRTASIKTTVSLTHCGLRRHRRRCDQEDAAYERFYARGDDYFHGGSSNCDEGASHPLDAPVCNLYRLGGSGVFNFSFFLRKDGENALRAWFFGGVRFARDAQSDCCVLCRGATPFARVLAKKCCAPGPAPAVDFFFFPENRRKCVSRACFFPAVS